MEERRQRRRWLVFVGFSWIQRRGRNVASRLIWRSSFVERHHYPSLLTVCFHGLPGEFFLKPHYRREGKTRRRTKKRKEADAWRKLYGPDHEPVLFLHFVSVDFWRSLKRLQLWLRLYARWRSSAAAFCGQFPFIFVWILEFGKRWTN